MNSISTCTLRVSSQTIITSLPKNNPTMDTNNMSPQQRAILSHVCEILHIQHYQVPQIAEFLVQHNWNIDTAIHFFLQSQQQGQMHPQYDLRFLNDVYDQNREEQSQNQDQLEQEWRYDNPEDEDEFHNDVYIVDREIDYSSFEQLQRLYLNSINQQREESNQYRRIVERQNQLYEQQRLIIQQKKEEISRKKRARLQIQPTISLKILPKVNPFDLFSFNTIMPTINLICYPFARPLMLRKPQLFTAFPLPNFPLMIKFRLHRQAHMHMFGRNDKIAQIFEYVDCNLRNSFEKVNADFELVQSCNTLLLDEQIHRYIYQVFGPSQGEVLIVKQLH